MLVVLGEIWVSEGCEQEYLALAEGLREAVSGIDGFISMERFTSVSEAGKIMSVSYWRDEEAVVEFRNLPANRVAETRAREALFRDYRVLVTDVIRDYGFRQREEAPADSRAVHG
ncbi:MAG TPA: antibiotic biosynthesis monooxygenase [Thermomicrobiales bacterium]|nr:antibiotic biosynthesis monooxygenase [Thermomicrobiales bacterium]